MSRFQNQLAETFLSIRSRVKALSRFPKVRVKKGKKVQNVKKIKKVKKVKKVEKVFC